jgi:hypothetical protein
MNHQTNFQAGTILAQNNCQGSELSVRVTNELVTKSPEIQELNMVCEKESSFYFLLKRSEVHDSILCFLKCLMLHSNFQ